MDLYYRIDKKYVEECWRAWDESDQRNRFKASMEEAKSITEIIFDKS